MLSVPSSSPLPSKGYSPQSPSPSEGRGDVPFWLGTSSHFSTSPRSPSSACSTPRSELCVGGTHSLSAALCSDDVLDRLDAVALSTVACRRRKSAAIERDAPPSPAEVNCSKLTSRSVCGAVDSTPASAQPLCVPQVHVPSPTPPLVRASTAITVSLVTDNDQNSHLRACRPCFGRRSITHALLPATARKRQPTHLTVEEPAAGSPPRMRDDGQGSIPLRYSRSAPTSPRTK